MTLEGFETQPLSNHVSQIVGKALESGSNTIQRIQFYLKDKSALEKKALKLATQEAVERFIVINEPASTALSQQFRRDLSAAFEWVASNKPLKSDRQKPCNYCETLFQEHMSNYCIMCGRLLPAA